MPVKFNVIERGKPGDPLAPKKYYASPIMSGETDLRDLTERIELISTVSGADIRAVLYAIVDIVPTLLKNGQVVKMGDLGNFRISFSSEGSDIPEEVSASNIRKSRIIFTPGTEFKFMLDTVEYTKA